MFSTLDDETLGACVTLTVQASVLVVYAKTEPEKEAHGITAFIIGEGATLSLKVSLARLLEERERNVQRGNTR